ncbi:uncharacterized protein K452DRAFT_271832 [Aplosporella prunicola CBS 121167]|uniref:Armadillo-like helical domain-containing protein n=1 Tax=Aplosporella prunicola CBS 121167 TaxID=1176127 RepID=A0A6A6BFC5_9PEZI|nr:uncharacterized protein K452DRAFT_271832 [Aplosporella prunicola CBS 121167]KAF2141181.1 hypothetical protein K452DRAFT_271832 [Aplosporella prunicola CBS 121167]
MEPSPLTQQSRPDSFKPKVVQLYETLFHADNEDADHSDGFWEEFFLLKPDPASLRRVLADLSPDALLHLQAPAQQLFARAIQRIKAARAPADDIALDTLTVFLGAVLSKKYTNPSSDILSVLAGLDDADAVLSEFVAALDVIIRSGRSKPIRRKAIRVALSITSGAYQTGIITFFTHRDLFPALMKFIQDSDPSSEAFEPFVLLGLLSNYNKFEFQNPYRLRLDDFVNDVAIKKTVQCLGSTCREARDKYVAVQDDLPEGWTLGGTLSWVGLGALTGSKPSSPVLSAEEAQSAFTSLPGPEAALLLSTYDFVNANKLFGFNLVNMPAADKTEITPFSAFLSLTSYLSQHAHRSTRTTLYAHLNLFILQIIIEDQVLVKRVCSDDSKTLVRLCRQRQPFLPVVKGDRVLATVLLDMMIDCVNHNLRRRLDTDLYIQSLGLILRIISFLGRSRIRLVYHWSELWRSLLSFIRFLTTYAADIKTLGHSSRLINDVVNVIALSLSTGESFLPDPAAYDDLFYKLVETGDILTKFRDAYDLTKSSTNNIETLVSVSAHYYALLEGDEKGKVKSKNLSPREVSKVIKQGYETLSIQAKEGLDHWDRYRETDHKSTLKRMARCAVEDAKALVAEK